MRSRHEQLLALYRRHRVEDQRGWYEARRAEFEQAVAQLGMVSGVVLAFGATCAALAGAGGHSTWAVLAAVFPAISTALAAYGTLYAFEQQAKLYGDAARALRRIEGRAPTADEPDAVVEFVATVEDVLRREQGQWGQLVADVPAAPHAK
jgi:hypothetical protein